ncbi:MAG TPA: type II secretion system F family protein [Candidatus Doudnabacteria bacterium]|nr:type II secretion system F family protein [Candidatus Doudnabacteria bacterium]
MPTFIYTAASKDGKQQSGIIEAADFLSAGHQLKDQGLVPLDIQEKGGVKWSEYLQSFGSVPLKVKIAFIQNLDLLLKSGVAAPRAMRIIAKQTANRKFRTIVDGLADDVEAGKSLHEAMSAYPKIFSHIFLSMIEVGELSGNLEKSLEYLRIQLQREADLKSKTKGAMIYPAVIVTAMIVIGILLAIFVLPSLTSTFKDFDTDLPILTRIVIIISDFMAANSILVIVGMIILAVGAVVGLQTTTGKRLLAWFLLHMPMINNITRKINIARFARILGSLMKSGISVVQGLVVTSEALSNVYYQEVLHETANDVKLGKPLTESLAKHEKLFPFIVTQMLAIGEETGNLEDILEQLASANEAEIDDTMKNLSSIIEPILLLVIGVVVGFLALALIMPIYNITQTIS